MADFVTCRVPRSQIPELVRGVVRAVTGRQPDARHVVDAVLTRGALVLVSKVQQAFLAKARGGTDEAGIRWEPLKRETVARRRTTKAELKSLGVTGERTRGFLTPSEDKRWRAIFGTRLAHFRAAGMDDGAAKARAAQIAWATLKKEGAKTKLDVLGGRVVEVGRDTGRLLASVTPGVESGEAGGDGLVRVEPGRIVVGSNVEYAAAFHARRALWPRGNPATLPAAWNRAVCEALARGLVRAVAGAVG